MKPKVSVIVPTKNSEEFLYNTLYSIKRQTFSDIEIIEVDNFSTDRTKQIAEYFKIKFIQQGPERTAQMNRGAKEARGYSLYFTGSDMTRDDDFIEKCVQKIMEGYDAVYMSVKTSKSVDYFWGRVKALEREIYIGTKVESARFVRINVFNELGGFDEKLIGCEEDFQHRLDEAGYKTAWIDAYEYHLHEDDTLKKVFQKSAYYGRYMKAYLKKHKGKGVKFLTSRPCFIKYWRLLVRNPILSLGLIIYKIVQFAGGVWGIIKS